MKQTATILDEIIATKKKGLARQKLEKPQTQLEAELLVTPGDDGPSFFEALKAESKQPKIIAEVKKASPSAGVLRDPFALADINEAYQAAACVVAISIITEQDYFQGSAGNLIYFAKHNTNHKPLLRKDFLFEPYQVLESKLLGAQAFLLIASLFEQDELQALVELGLHIGIEPLVEVHTPAELAMARQTLARCIGVNSRDLSSFLVQVATHELLSELPDSYARVAESGIDSSERLRSVSNIADAALIGSQFMRSANIAAEIEHMVGQGTI